MTAPASALASGGVVAPPELAPDDPWLDPLLDPLFEVPAPELELPEEPPVKKPAPASSSRAGPPLAPPELAGNEPLPQ